MTRETKIGIAMVLVLVGVFGFLVYKRTMRPGENLAQNEQAGEDIPDGEDNAELSGDLTPTPIKEFGDDNEEEPEEIVPVAAKSKPIPREPVEETVSDPFGVSESTEPANEESQPQLLTMPDETPEESTVAANEFESFGSDEPTSKSSNQPEVEEFTSREPEIDNSDPFAGAETETTEVSTDEPAMESESMAEVSETASSPALEFESAEMSQEESFGSNLETVKEEPEPVMPVKPVPVAKQPVKSFETVEAEPEEISVSARATIPDRSLDFGDEEPDEKMEEAAASEPVLEFEAVPQRADEPVVSRPVASQPAPELMLETSSVEDRYGDYEPIELAEADEPDPFGVANVRSDAGRTVGKKNPQDSITGDRHQVQSGESFWSISQRKYGSGRYFQALAAYNQKVVPDASKMKPGIEIMLPSVEELERRYPALVSATGQAEPGAAAGGGAQVRGEYMVSNGEPMYRIGTGDTLSSIAQRYLGRARRWEQILVMNRDVLKDGNSLKVGAVLRLPSDATQLQLTNQPKEFR